MKNPVPCPYCNGHHAGKCPLVKAIEYHENGTTKRVEFFPPASYPPLLPMGHFLGGEPGSA